MSAEVEDGEGTDVAYAVYVNGEFPEEIDDRTSAGWKGEEEDEWGEEDGQEFGEEDIDLERE